MKTIYLYCLPLRGDVVGYALTPEGECLASHISSDKQWAKHDMGYTSGWHHDAYREYAPEGFKLEWVDAPETSAEVRAAIAANRQRYAKDDSA